VTNKNVQYAVAVLRRLWCCLFA